MEIIGNKIKQVSAANGCVIRRKNNKDSVFSKCGMLPHETLEDFEELTKEAYEAEQNANKLNEEYSNLVEQKVRAKYSVSAELAILRQRDTKQEEFDAYNAYVEQCKQEAKSELGIE